MKFAFACICFLALSACALAEEAKEETPVLEFSGFQEKQKPVASKNVDELFAAALAKLSPEHRKIVEDTLGSPEEEVEKKEEEKKDEKRVRRTTW
ncbi:hypothetical protein PRIPAC_87809 [Pristionchus pacificus]|uniref:Uncharacterized protein n=1 Tax=Pristionchus pacificus TaxID=54126 RepID=A0A454XNQ3_PRIPA|nr:hypothetical protein PRIPAC_87809 [Pristionchus pacificus]|eukprot:PDM82284.1 hypothetical protein PRIPAC_36677 [Pristionchus pacificus]